MRNWSRWTFLYQPLSSEYGTYRIILRPDSGLVVQVKVLRTLTVFSSSLVARKRSISFDAFQLSVSVPEI